jgi:hypothetical protein
MTSTNSPKIKLYELIHANISKLLTEFFYDVREKVEIDSTVIDLLIKNVSNQVKSSITYSGENKVKDYDFTR